MALHVTSTELPVFILFVTWAYPVEDYSVSGTKYMLWESIPFAVGTGREPPSPSPTLRVLVWFLSDCGLHSQPAIRTGEL